MTITREDAKNYFIKLSENEPEDYYFQFIAKCDIVPDEIFAKMENRSDIRPTVIEYKIPKVKKLELEIYFLFNNQIIRKVNKNGTK